jgi:hypothetical protein
VLKDFPVPVRKAISLIHNEEAFYELTYGRHAEHPYLHHCLIHFDKRPGKIDTIYNIFTHPDLLEIAKQLAQEFKEHIKRDNNWGGSDGCMIVEDEPPGNN